jgi:DNA polymerase-3 subunit delta
MAQLKAHEIDSWLAKARPPTPVVLIYGPDRGLVSERAQRYAALSGLALDDPFSVVRLEAGELDKDPGRLLDEANTIPMFAGRRLLWVKNGGAQKTLADDVKTLCKDPPADCVVLIEAGDLKKSAPLRTAVEAATAGLTMPCYADDARSVDTVIDDELGKAGMAIDPEARQLLRRSLGGDRMASRAEVQKLVLYCMGETAITVDDIRALTGDVSALSVDETVNAAIDGNIAGFDAAFARQATAGGQTYPVLSAAMRQMQSLHMMRGTMEAERRPASAMVASARPPIFYQRRKAVEDALERWDSEGLARVLTRLQDTVLQTRRRPDLATALARQALLGIAVESARRSRRNG